MKSKCSLFVHKCSNRNTCLVKQSGQEDSYRSLSEMVGGHHCSEIAQEALAFEEYRQRIASLNGISEASAAKISEQYPDATSLCKARKLAKHLSSQSEVI